MTPAQAAGIKFPFRNWKDVVEQPIEVTARIPIECVESDVSGDASDVELPRPKVVRKAKSVKHKRRTVTPMTSLRGIRK